MQRTEQRMRADPSLAVILLRDWGGEATFGSLPYLHSVFGLPFFSFYQRHSDLPTGPRSRWKCSQYPKSQESKNLGDDGSILLLRFVFSGSPISHWRFPILASCKKYWGIDATHIHLSFITLSLVNTTFSRTYNIQYGLSPSIVGLCYLSNALGCIIGAILGGRFSDGLYNKRVKKSKENSYPEMRLGGPVIYGATFIQLVSFVAYGWCVQKNVHWAFGLVCQLFSKSHQLSLTVH